ncbi:hypothetical protein BZG79_10390 [Salinivibrio sp. MA427]|uniref:hypothetical protein n=1 Tax=unclassified Salinivibrio TaxID=2636825 RepID=UPI00098974EF|nr:MULTISPECIES: hypothetical protein [unclassified Salinivibrio]OOF02282.1 hypothetical protein BZG80_12980 [Salinivibrio sp. MA440]OOF10618.1 hypothetical protein BZG79_10390 [Salinivibrio sp. MA427]
MDKRLYLSLLLPLALAGCGGGDDGGGSKPTPKYTIDFASFYVTETEKDSTRCDIYDEKIYYENVDPSDPNYDPDAEPEVDYREWVHANKVKNTRLRVAVHSAQGQLLETYSAGSSSWSNSGTLQINKSKIPSDGYLTIYESVIRPGGIKFLDSVSYHKSLLSNNMRFSDFQPQRGEGSCITTGQDFPNLRDIKQTLEDGGDSSGQVFGINSRYDTFWATSPINVEAKLDNKQSLAVRYERLESDTPENVDDSIQKDKYRQINAYRLLDLRDITSKPLEMNEIGDDYRDGTNYWYAPLAGNGRLDNVSLSIESGGEPLFWQALPNDRDGYYGYAHKIGGTNYYISGSGVVDGWGIEFTDKPKDVSTGIDYSTWLQNLDIPYRTDTEIVSCGSSETGACLRSYASGGEGSWDIQRSFLLLEDGFGGQIRQVIYSKPQSTLPLLTFTGFDLFVNDNLQKSKVSLFSSSDRDASEFFFSGKIDVRGIATADPQASLDPNNDGMALLHTEFERAEALSELRVQPLKVLSATD